MSSQFAGQSCGIYPRVSTEKQAKEGRTSLKDQEQACRDYADEMGLVVDEECVEPEAYTSTKMSRPGLNTLLATMQAKKVPHLLIDTADRMTRQGIKVAYEFLQQFTDADITLHVVSMELIVDDDKKLLEFLEAAYRAQLDNQQRTRKAHRARISRAKNGNFIRGSKPPYGYKYTPVDWDEMGNPTDRKLEPDERPFSERGFNTIFAVSPYAARREILRLYTQEGWSLQRIAHRLNDAGVPTLTVLLHRSGARGDWWAKVVNDIISHPINQDQLVNTFRFKSEKPGQAARPDEVIQVNSIHGNPEPLLDEQALAIVVRRRRENRDGAYIRTSIHSGHTLLGGALAKCGICGGSLRVQGSRYGSHHYLYYTCSRHEKLPRSCPGMSVAVKNVDAVAWAEVVYALHNIEYDPSRPDSAEKALAKLDAGGDAQRARPNGPTLDQLKTVRAKLFHDAETYALEMVRVQSQLARDTLQRQIDRLEPEIAKADAEIAVMERQSTLQKERANVLAHFMGKYTQYFAYLQVLDVDNESDIPIMAAILRALGAVVTVPPSYTTRNMEKLKREAEPGTLDLGPDEPIHVDLTLTAGVGFPWTGNDELLRMLDERVARRIEWERRLLDSDNPDFTAPRGTSG